MSETTPESSPRQMASNARDRVRFEEEALKLSDQVYQVARRLAGSKEEAEDLVQETYARAFRAWRSFEPGTNLRAWLFRILTNLNIDRGRKLQRSPDTQPLEENDYFLYNRLEESTADQNVDERRVVDRLSQNDAVTALADLPHDFRDVVLLVDLADFTYSDAAQILDIPIGTVMSRLHRGRKALQRALWDFARQRGLVTGTPDGKAEE
jgi:RNA polymerase sigma-70 factor, ECF subfamily